MTDKTNTPTDADILKLTGGAFDSLPRAAVLPLDLFAVAEHEPPTLRRNRHDSLAPTSTASVAPPRMAEAPAGASRAWTALGFVMCSLLAGATGAFGMRALGGSPAAPLQAPAAAAQAAPPPAMAEAPAAPPVAAEPAKAEPMKSEPVKAQPAPVKAAAAAKPVVAQPAAAPAPVDTADLPAAMPQIPPLPPRPTVDISKSAVTVAIADAGMRAASCREDGGTLNVPVSVTFAPSGHAVSARITGGPLAGTPEGACLARTLSGASVPAFDGESVTVHTSVYLR